MKIILNVYKIYEKNIQRQKKTYENIHLKDDENGSANCRI